MLSGRTAIVQRRKMSFVFDFSLAVVCHQAGKRSRQSAQNCVGSFGPELVHYPTAVQGDDCSNKGAFGNDPRPATRKNQPLLAATSVKQRAVNLGINPIARLIRYSGSSCFRRGPGQDALVGLFLRLAFVGPVAMIEVPEHLPLIEWVDIVAHLQGSPAAPRLSTTSGAIS